MAVNLDCIVIGGGPAGLVAATYLARFRRRVRLLSEGPPRAAWIPRTRNVPAYPDGLVGRDLVGRLRRQAGRYGVALQAARVSALRREGEGFVAALPAGEVAAPYVILATGVQDQLHPALEGQWGAVRAGAVRLCPICDAYELSDTPLLVLGRGVHGGREALFLRGYSARVTLLTDGRPAEELPAPLRRQLADAGVAVATAPVRHIHGERRGVVVATAGPAELRARALYIALGAQVRSGLAAALGAQRDPDGYLLVDPHQQTSVPGLYAAGDVVQSLSQISVAFGQAAIAASAVHNRLREAGVPTAPTGRAA